MKPSRPMGPWDGRKSLWVRCEEVSDRIPIANSIVMADTRSNAIG
ncbi:hypothetical protein FOQG_18078 [Fusarium oxysporum f. sp. raphani 54005]|uniref:Uncharacterized protein n=1 Tax=Fusarium oxysporum f. sp. raphani 54005 TaxID=1089458 RepID=X0C369_FUSOX|nr:hypothetical protein FOQG_18078 [Fusarium oxysporum f. sp. raphani 54005]EXL39826.1 hypothetical protein FOCG_17587 [Fusarium oxysporum f. sp. radicis-lycopersici 26381]